MYAFGARWCGYAVPGKRLVFGARDVCCRPLSFLGERKIRHAFLRCTGTGGLDRSVLANTDCNPLCIPRRSLGQSPLAGKCAEFSARRTAFIAGGLKPLHNERAEREVIPATLCTRNTHQALLKPAHPYKHTNHMTSYNPDRVGGLSPPSHTTVRAIYGIQRFPSRVRGIDSTRLTLPVATTRYPWRCGRVGCTLCATTCTPLPLSRSAACACSRCSPKTFGCLSGACIA